MRLISATSFKAKDGVVFPSRSFHWDAGPVLDACAVEASYGHLLVLTADGALHGADLNTNESRRLCGISLPSMEAEDGGSYFGRPRYRLHSSADGRYAAVVVDRGRYGTVVDTRGGAVTMHLHGGDYCEETVPFSACFLRFNGRDVFIHRTAWNRLDVSDPATGRCLTERHIAPYETSGQMPAHYLDYFHGQLLPSPEGGLIFDDGWVWHPISIPRVWSVTKWLTANPWESEDGASIVDLPMRDDWTQPTCWIDEQRLAMWGSGEWDEEESEEVKRGPGLRIFDVAGTKPSIGEWWPMEGVNNLPNLFSDGKRLYVASDGGTTTWEIASRTPIAEFPGFVAQLLHRSRRALVCFGPDSIRDIVLTL